MDPGPARIGRFVDAVAVGDVDPDGGLAGAGIDHIGIRGRHRDRADGGASHEAVGDAAPVDAAVYGLPDAAGAGAEIGNHLVRGIARDGDHAAAPRRTDASPFQATKVRGRGNAGRCRHEGKSGGEKKRRRICSRNRRRAPQDAASNSGLTSPASMRALRFGRLLHPAMRVRQGRLRGATRSELGPAAEPRTQVRLFKGEGQRLRRLWRCRRYRRGRYGASEPFRLALRGRQYLADGLHHRRESVLNHHPAQLASMVDLVDRTAPCASCSDCPT